MVKACSAWSQERGRLTLQSSKLPATATVRGRERPAGGLYLRRHATNCREAIVPTLLMLSWALEDDADLERLLVPSSSTPPGLGDFPETATLVFENARIDCPSLSVMPNCEEVDGSGVKLWDSIIVCISKGALVGIGPGEVAMIVP